MSSKHFIRIWLKYVKKHRALILTALAIFPIINIYLSYYDGSLQKETGVIMAAMSAFFWMNLYSFFYDKSYSIGAASYPADGSNGRFVFAAIFFIGYIIVQFI